MTGFNGEVPKIETEAFPILENSDASFYKEPKTSEVKTKSSFTTFGDKSLMILETRYGKMSGKVARRHGDPYEIRHTSVRGKLSQWRINVGQCYQQPVQMQE